MKKTVLAAVCLMASALVCGCSSSTSTTVYYGYDIDSVSEITSGSKDSLDTDLKSVLLMYSGWSDCENDLASDFKTACKFYDNRVEGIALLLRSNDLTEQGTLAEPVEEVARYTFKSKIKPE